MSTDDSMYDWAESVSSPEDPEAEITLPEDVREALGEEPADLPLQPSVTRQTVEWVAPHTLRVHPRNREVYGDMAPPADLLDSIRGGWSATSILEALPDGTLIKGHLRRFAAIQLHVSQVPVHYREDLTDDEAAQVEELLRDNAGRVKTREIICREYRLAFETFKEETGSVAGEKSRDVVGRRFGCSGVTLEHGIAVANALDNRRLAGETREKIRKALNERGIEPAWKLLRKSQQDAPDDAEPAFEGEGATALAIPAAKRHKALQDVLKAVDDRLPLLGDPEALVAAIPRENLDASLAEVQTLLNLLGNIEAEIRDRLDVGARKPRRKKSGA